MTDKSARYALPLLQSGQAQKEVTHNGAIAGIDALLHLAVENRALSTPPAVPIVPGCWIVGNAAAGGWAGQSGKLAVLDAAGWSFVVPRDGCLAFIRDEGVFAWYATGTWRSDAWPVHALLVGGRTLLGATPGVVASPVGGSVIDVEARASLVALVGALRAMGLVTTG